MSEPTQENVEEEASAMLGGDDVQEMAEEAPMSQLDPEETDAPL